LTSSDFAHVLGKGEGGVHSMLSGFGGIPSASASFFWEFDDDLGLLEPFGQFLVLSPQLLVVGNQLTLPIGLAASSPGSQAAENPLLALVAPESQTGRIQPLTAQ